MSWKRSSLAVLLVGAACTFPLSERKGENEAVKASPLYTAPPPSGSLVRVTTQHNDNQRTGANLTETILRPENVNSSTFGLLFSLPVDQQVYAQPLYMGSTQVVDSLDGQTKTANVVYVATMNNTIYAFDGDTERAPYWSVQVGPPDTGTASNIWATGHVPPELNTFGILSTPVIDPAAGVMFAVAREKKPGCVVPGSCAADADARYRIYRLALTTGQVLASSTLRTLPAPTRYPTSGMCPVCDQKNPGSDSRPRFYPDMTLQRPGLLLAGGRVYIGFGSQFEDLDAGHHFHGWIFAYDAAFANDADEADALCTTPHRQAGGVWQAGNGLTADPTGSRIFFMTGNGWIAPEPGNMFPPTAPVDYEASFVRVDLNTPGAIGPVFSNPTLRPADSFYDVEYRDQDLGSSGPVLLPSGLTADEILVGGGKTGKLAAIFARRAAPFADTFSDRQPSFQAFVDSYRHRRGIDPATNTFVDYSKKPLQSAGPHIHGGPVFWSRGVQGESYLYAWSERDHLRRFRFNTSTNLFEVPPFSSYTDGSEDSAFAAVYRQSTERAPSDMMPGGALSVSASGTDTATGIVWATVNKEDGLWGPRSGYFEAYKADTLGAPLFKEFIPLLAKYAAPTVANGHVYVPTFQYQLRVYGLRQLSPAPTTWTGPTNFAFCAGAGKSLLVGDFNGDGRADLACHTAATGSVELSFARFDNQYAHSTSALTSFCVNESVKVGDFDGDAHADLYCGMSDVTIAFSEGAGVFRVSPQPLTGGCGPPAEIHIGDFDGDGRSDVLCHSPQYGHKSVRFTGRAGQLDAGPPGLGTWPVCNSALVASHVPCCGWTADRPRCDWAAASGWCVSPAQLSVGDFNGDGIDDLMCHALNASAEKWIMLANPPVHPIWDGTDTFVRMPTYALFGGTTHHATLPHGWCGGTTSPDVFGVADMSGDKLADMYCHEPNNGSEWVDYAYGSPLFAPIGTSTITSSRTWCAPSATFPNPEWRLADVDGDARADVVCHDKTTGRIGVEYSPIGGVINDVGCGPGSTGCWMIGSERGYSGGNFIYKQNGYGSWGIMPGAAVAIDVGPNGPWVVNSGGVVYSWNGSGWTDRGSPANQGAIDVGVGADGTVWVINGVTKAAYKWNGSGWVSNPGGGDRIDVDPNGLPWLVNNSNGQVWQYNGTTWQDRSFGTFYGWDVGIGSDGGVYIVRRDGNYSIAKWNGSTWVNVPGKTGRRVTGMSSGVPMATPGNGDLPN